MDNYLALGYGASEAGTNVKGAAKNAAATKKNERPTHDQMYLARKLSRDPDVKVELSPAAIQRLNTRYGAQTVVNAMRLLHGFPPEIAVRSSYAYLETICKGSK